MQNLVQKFIAWFFVLIAVYHIIVTVLWYWIMWWESQILISIWRDLIWLLFIVAMFLGNISHIKDYLKKWKNVWIWFIGLLLFSIWVSALNWQSIANMMIGIKYWFFYLFIFLSASFVWYIWLKKIKTQHINWFQYFLMWIVVFGFLWQIMKVIRPEIFMNIGYGKFDDFYFGSNPPIYYLTGFEWTTRWQWLFSWPNNYGYFLVAFLPLILLWRSKWVKSIGWLFEKIKNIFLMPTQSSSILFVVLRILAIAMTLSRAAVIGAILVFVLLAKDWIKKNKKTSIALFWIMILWVVWLSVIKSESTIWHIQAKLWYIWEIIDNPLWHGLGSSGPAVHHEWTMLPENYFMQIMLDIGTVGFIIWTIVLFQMLLIFKNISLNINNNKLDTSDQIAFLQWKRLYLWRTILLVIGLFLHVFEDSMVNYLFFVSFGLLSGYMSSLYKNNKLEFKDLFIKK